MQVINKDGCRDIMYNWYRAGFIENIIMAIIGLGVGAFLFYLYSVNRKEYYKLLDDYDDMRKPMMNGTMSMSTINSKVSTNPLLGTGHIVNFGQKPSKYSSVPMQRLVNQNTPSIGGENIYAGGSIGGGSGANQLPQLNSELNESYNNPLQTLQNIQNSSGRFPFSKGRTNSNYNGTPSDRFGIE